MRKEIRRLAVTFLPSAWVTLSIIYLDLETLGGALGKLAFVFTMAALAFSFFNLLHPRTGVFHNFFGRHRDRPVTRLRYLWITAAVGAPLLLAGLALGGYLYTAGTLTEHLINTLWLVLVLAVVHQLAVRWLLLIRRRLAYQAALERREAARAAQAAKESAHLESESPMEIEQPAVDLAALSDESRKLLNASIVFGGIVALWAIWSGVLPAFGILNEIALWYHTAVVDGEERRLPITLADAGLAILILIATLVAARSLPALLEIALLQRLDVTSGSRYAITTLSSYAIGALGLLLAFNTIGANWSQIQWLVAALGVGIGFGLQEIVANFISGLIILFERPIRVGDVVTVGDTDGVVTRIRIRATTIRNWDRKELLVPNKEFITGRLLNWSLSDQINRIVIVVGVAYDSDVEEALGLIAAAAREHPEVLDDPSPLVTFEGFGDNSLTLLLRCYLASLDNRLSTITDLHKSINRKFKAAGIVIAYPQRDLHLDTSRPLDIRIQQSKLGNDERSGR
jgi:potassium efflux system protein